MPDQMVELGAVANPLPGSFVDGPFGSEMRSSEYTDSGVRLIQLQNIGDGTWNDANKKFISHEKFATLRRHGASAGDIAIAKMADPVARCCVIPPVADQFVVVADCIKLRPNNDEFDARYVYRAINAHQARREAETLSTGTTRLRINLSALKRVRIWAPPKKEQTRIAAILDTMDEAIAKTEAVIAKLRQVRAGLLHDLLTCGLDTNGELRDPAAQPEQFQDSPLGRVPRGWRVRKLGDLVSTDRPIVYGILMPGRGYQGGVPVIKVKDIRAGTIDTSDLLLTDPQIDEAYSRSRVRTGDLLFTIRGTVGRMAFVPPELNGANITQDTARISLHQVNRLFIARWLETPIPSRFVNVHTIGVAVRGINLLEVRRIPVVVPTKEEQDAIAKVISTTERKIEVESRVLKCLAELKSGLMADLLTGRVRVPEAVVASSQTT